MTTRFLLRAATKHPEVGDDPWERLLTFAPAFAHGGHKVSVSAAQLFVSEVRQSIQTAELAHSWKFMVCLPPSNRHLFSRASCCASVITVLSCWCSHRIPQNRQKLMIRVFLGVVNTYGV